MSLVLCIPSNYPHPVFFTMVQFAPSLRALFALWSLVLFSASVQAQNRAVQNPSFVATFNKVSCSTLLTTGNAVKPLPTQTKVTTKYFTNTIRVGRTPKATITPAPVTVVSTATQTVTTTSTDLAVTDTLTVVTTPTVTQTQTATATQFTTVDGGTVTITTTSTILKPTNNNFTPAASQIVAAGSQPYRRALPTIAPDTHLLVRGKKDNPFVRCGQPNNLKNKSVVCNKVVNVVTEVIAIGFLQSTKTITAAPQTATQQTTVTATSTVTVAPPHVSVTETNTAPTVTSNVAATVTQMQTVSTTVTATATATTSAYAACSTNNVIGAINGKGITTFFYGNLQQLTDTDAQSAMECCQNCQDAGTGCNAFYFLQGGCTLAAASANQCPASYQIDASDPSTGPGQAFFVGNGLCGNLGFSTSSPSSGEEV